MHKVAVTPKGTRPRAKEEEGEDEEDEEGEGRFKVQQVQ